MRELNTEDFSHNILTVYHFLLVPLCSKTSSAHLASKVVLECRQVEGTSLPSVNKPCEGQLH